MNVSDIVNPLIGGVFIGIAASMLWLLLGRVFGVSGILAGALMPKPGEDRAWRVAVLAGFMTAGLILLRWYPSAFPMAMHGSIWRYMAAGLMVGYGTRLGGGCTSGHGVCGISRLSLRSIVATIVFIAFGMLTVTLCRAFGVSL